MVVGGGVGGRGRSGLCGRGVVFIWRCHSTSFLSSSSLWWRKSRQMASTRNENWPLLPPESATRLAIWPQSSFQLRSGYKNSEPLTCAPRGGKSIGTRGAEGVLWPFRGGFGCFLSLFRGLALQVPWVWWYRISLFICLLGKFDWLVSRQTTVRQFIFWGVQFPSFLIYISIY